MFFPSLTLLEPSDRTSIVVQADWLLDSQRYRPILWETQSGRHEMMMAARSGNEEHASSKRVREFIGGPSPQVNRTPSRTRAFARGVAPGHQTSLGQHSLFEFSLFQIITRFDPFDSLLHGQLVSLTTSIWSLLSPLSTFFWKLLENPRIQRTTIYGCKDYLDYQLFTRDFKSSSLIHSLDLFQTETSFIKDTGKKEDFYNSLDIK